MAQGVLLAAAIGMAGPAMAQRGIDIDNDADPVLTICSLGSACAGNSLANSPANQAFYGSTVVGAVTVQYFEVQQVFIYREGVVSFGAELPSDASVAGGLASLGAGNWFAPGLGAATDAIAFDHGFGKIQIGRAHV